MKPTQADQATLDATVEPTIDPGDAGTTTTTGGAAQEPAPAAPNLWTDPDPVWTQDPARVRPADLALVRDRARLSGPALLRDALVVGRVRRACANAKRDTRWIPAAAGCSERRTQHYRQLADALDGRTEGVVVEGALPSPDGLTEPPARWLEMGVDGALDEVRAALKALRDAEIKAEEKAEAELLAEAEKELSFEAREAKALAAARAQVGAAAWNEDAAVVVDALTSHPVLADEVVDGMVGALVQGVHALPPCDRVAALQRAEKAIRVAVEAAEAEALAAQEANREAAEQAEADAELLDDVIGAEGGDA